MTRQFRSDDTSHWNEKFGNSSDGSYAPSTGVDSVIDSACTGTSGTTSLSATNAGFAIGQLILIHQTRGASAGVYELNKIANYSAGTITTSYPLCNTYGTGAQVLVMPQLASGNIAGGVTITGKAWNGTVGGIYAKFCNGTFTIAGSLVASGVGFRGGAASSNNALNGNPAGQAGEGNPGLGTNTYATNCYSANGNGGGGGVNGSGPQAGGTGGGGGNGTTGSGGTSQAGGIAGAGGGAVGNVGLTSMLFGGGGGGSQGQNNTAAAGGNAGGIILIIAKNIPTITGNIYINGNAGGNAATSGAGGGAGGSCLLKFQTGDMGTNKITVAAGSGGTGSYAGGAGSVGRIHADYSSSITGTTSPALDSTQDFSLNTGSGMFLIF